MQFAVKFILLCLVLVPYAVFAEIPKQLENDFAVIEGVVVMPLNDEYIVSMNDQGVLSIGDILTVVRPGKKIFHPETKEVIGAVDNVVGFLQITRIHTGYS